MAGLTKKIIILNSVDSTNNYAMGLVKKGEAADGQAVFAMEQTIGRGRQGRHWISEPGANLQISYIISMEWASMRDQFFLSMAVSLSVAELIMHCSKSEVFVKWPNDVIINDKKAAGILIENVIHGSLWQWAVIGIGLNVNQKKFGNIKATSLAIETQKEFDVFEVARQLQTILHQNIRDMKKGLNSKLMKSYNQMLYKRNQKVKLKVGNRVFETVVIGVTEDGRLKTQDVFEQEWDLDTASIRY